ncbi:SLATT domain-containing protein [Marivirga arenosa]|uniref:SLATT domain-containing protein n=1 Tax=Marivirga arenosa TaxID=3059076 RepID=A0AA51N8A9_9BACT|nr:SLATT domain-containing protein [Marivirga sp. ABR2-2]WMN07799.1 SLATT domain-containing protein [Marivirga sp. ABR2-2]
MEQEVERWYNKLWETKGARFIAAHRLELHEKLSVIAISLISVYIISLNLLVLFPVSKRSELFNNLNITYSTICLSILILVVSLIISSRNYKLRAEKYHECGRQIMRLHDKICLWKNSNYSPSSDEIEQISSEYLNVLDKYENHKRIDFLTFQANNLLHYKDISCKKLFWLKVKSLYFVQIIGIYLLPIFSPLILLII